ncbi:MAG TPA: IS110 family transposase, partial [Gemmataceae bacterium]|nr:IS110 family transposase [Gemmataceae bacterium]
KGYRRRKAKAHDKVHARQEADVRRLEGLPVTQAHAAGVDIGSWSHWVCVGADDAAHLREFPAHTDGLHALVAFLHEHQVTTVAMESTGIYWIPLYELLEAHGVEVLLVDPSYTKQVRGRPKTDRRDCQWIYRLHSVGLLAAAFRPDEKTCQLRSYLRQRANLIRYAGQHIQHMQKALEQMNLKLTEILSDITGRTGRDILKAILRGARDPATLAKYRHTKCQASEAEIAQSLTGTYRDEHLFALRQAYQAWEFYQKQRDQLDVQIAQQLARMKQDRALPPLKSRARSGGRKPNEPRFDVRAALYYVVGIDLTEIEGIGPMTALTLISEIGPEVSKFATVKHFCSWLGLCPQTKKSGGRVLSSRTRPGVNRATLALQMAASSLHGSKGALGAFLRHKKAQLGAPKAITATAHKLARLVYLALKHGMTYVRQTQEEYQAKMREQQLKSLRKKAKQLGLTVIIDPPPAEPAATATAGT